MIIGKIYISILFVSIFLSDRVFSQDSQQKAKEILNKTSAEYKSNKSLKANFKYTLEIRQEDFKEEQNGTIYLMDKKFKLDLGDQQIISDGVNIWTYLEDVNEVQISTYNPAEMDVNPSEMFTMYESGYLYAYAGEVTDKGKSLHVIELTPEDKSESYFKVKLFIDKSNYKIVKSQIFEKNGNIYTYEILDQKPNPDLPDDFFTFNKSNHPKVTVIDLR